MNRSVVLDGGVGGFTAKNGRAHGFTDLLRYSEAGGGGGPPKALMIARPMFDIVS